MIFWKSIKRRLLQSLLKVDVKKLLYHKHCRKFVIIQSSLARFRKNLKSFHLLFYGCYNTVVILMLYASQNLENKQIKQKRKIKANTKVEKSYPSLITLPF